MSLRAANIVRALVRHLDGDEAAQGLLARLLEELDVSLAGLVPPPAGGDLGPPVPQGPPGPAAPTFPQVIPRAPDRRGRAGG